jgi:hypothetical protein
VKNYLITRKPDNSLHLLAQEQDKTGFVSKEIPGQFDIGNAGSGTQALALEILLHFYGPKAADEAARKADRFMLAFLTHQNMPPGSTYEISGDVISNYLAKI